MKGKLVATIALAVVLLTVSIGYSQQAAKTGPVIKWKLHWYAPPQVGYDYFVVGLAKKIKTMTNGQFDITPYPGDSIVPASQLLEATQKGTIEAAITMASYHSGVMPVTNLLYGYPATYATFSDVTMHHAMFGFNDVLTRAFDAQGVTYLGNVFNPGVALVMKKPIRKIADFKGLKIRATGGAADVLKELGVSVVFTTGAELYTALSTGVIDGAAYGGWETALEQAKLGDVVKYTLTPKFMSVHVPNTLIVNNRAWKELPVEYQVILKTTIDALNADYYPTMDYAERKVLNAWLAKSGKELITLPSAEYAKIGVASKKVLEAQVAAKKDKFFTEGYETLKKFMEWKGDWK